MSDETLSPKLEFILDKVKYGDISIEHGIDRILAVVQEHYKETTLRHWAYVEELNQQLADLWAKYEVLEQHERNAHGCTLLEDDDCACLSCMYHLAVERISTLESELATKEVDDGK